MIKQMIFPLLMGLTLAALVTTTLFFVGRWVLATAIDRRIEKYQKNLIEKHFMEVENIYRQMRGWRHDYHNHIQVMKAYLDMGKYVEMDQHLLGLLENLRQVDQVIKSGNIMVDAILNSKLSLMEAGKISVNAKATVPPKHNISDVDLCAIMGNLLDNAMKGAATLEDESQRFVRIYIRPMKGQLYISVTNSARGLPKKGYASTKAARGHGLGLKRVDHLVARYGGYVNRQAEDGVFATEISMPFVLES